MRTGGTTTHNGDQLDEELDRLGAVVETFVEGDSGGAYLSVLKEDADRGLTLLADILRNPKFPEDKIEIAKIAERNAIARPGAADDSRRRNASPRHQAPEATVVLHVAGPRQGPL